MRALVLSGQFYHYGLRCVSARTSDRPSASRSVRTSVQFFAHILNLISLIHINILHWTLQTTSRAGTEIEEKMINWIGKMLSLPEDFLFSDQFSSLGGGVLQVNVTFVSTWWLLFTFDLGSSPGLVGLLMIDLLEMTYP